VRLALKSLRGNVKLLVESLAALPVVEEWVVHVHSSYNKWNSTYNEFGPFESGIFNGWDFMDIISRALALRQESLDTVRLAKSQEGKPLDVRAEVMEDSVNGDKWVELGNDLMDNFAFGPWTELYGESAGLTDGCKGHEFIELPASSELSDDQKANFDEHKRLKNEFFEGLLQRYALEHPEKPSPELDTNRQDEKLADKPLEETRAQVNLPEATRTYLDEHPPRPSSPDGNSKESTQSYIPTSSHSGLDYEGGTSSRSKGKGVKANDKADGSDTDDDSESVSSLDSVLSNVEILLADTPLAELPDVIANLISIVIKSKDRSHDSLFARRLVSRLVKKAGPWPLAYEKGAFQGKYEAAEEMNRQALDGKKVLGREHPYAPLIDSILATRLRDGLEPMASPTSDDSSSEENSDTEAFYERFRSLLSEVELMASSTSDDSSSEDNFGYVSSEDELEPMASSTQTSADNIEYRQATP
jgi:hypothetical protein